MKVCCLTVDACFLCPHCHYSIDSPLILKDHRNRHLLDMCRDRITRRRDCQHPPLND